MSTNYFVGNIDSEDDGTIVQSVIDLSDAVVGHKIVAVEEGHPFRITLDNGKTVQLNDVSDCCAYMAEREMDELVRVYWGDFHESS